MVILYCLLLFASLVNCDSDCTGTIAQGKIRGQEEDDADGVKFCSYHGIPYGKSPEGKQRFRDSEEADGWNGIFDARLEGESCIAKQFEMTPEGIELVLKGSENCLIVNVYARKTPNLKPVLFFLHGGGFVTGSSTREMYGPGFLMVEDVVLVTINYRLGAFGFLSFKDNSLEASGNAALKDMILALKWVQKNIKEFGGDPGKVMIFGQSAGSVCVEALIMSPLAKALFHSAIMQSGNIANGWGFGQNDPFALAKSLGFTSTDEREVFEFLQKTDPSELVNASWNIEPEFGISVVRPFGLNMESKSDPIKMFNKVPVMLGYTSYEGLSLNIFRSLNTNAMLSKDFVPFYLGLEKYSAKYNETSKKLNQHYFGSDSADLSNTEALYKIYSELLFDYGIQNSVKNFVETSSEPVFFYRMSLDSDMNFIKLMAGVDHEGVAHGDDLFKPEIVSNPEPGSIADVSFRRFVRMWANFARTGNPTPEKYSLLNVEWKPVTKGEMNYLDIGEQLIVKKDPDAEAIVFSNDKL